MHRGCRLIRPLLVLLCLVLIVFSLPVIVAADVNQSHLTAVDLSDERKGAVGSVQSLGFEQTELKASGVDDNETADTVETETVDGDTHSLTYREETNVELHKELERMPDRKGTIFVTNRYDVPEQTRLLEVRVPEEATVVVEDGFEYREEGTYVWDGRTSSPRLGFEYAVNRTVDQTGPIAGPGQHIFVDVGEWALIRQPFSGHRIGWSGPGRPGFDRQVGTDGPGSSSDVIAFLGEHEEYTHEAHGQTFRLIVPEAAGLEENPEDIFSSLAFASDILRVGERDDEVFVVAAPTGDVEWGVRGLQTGPADAWVRDFERLDDVDNVWIHEYVHTRQGYRAASDVQWFTEGSATYYATRLTLEQGEIDFRQFAGVLERGLHPRIGESVLSDRSSWQHNADYHLGALVTGALDRQLRLATDGEASMENVFRAMNAHDDVVTASTFQSFLLAAAGEGVSDFGARYTDTTERPATWSETAHEEAFGMMPARITVALTPDALSVSGPFRDRPLNRGDGAVLVPGETLSLSVNVTNFGGEPGAYEASFQVDGQDREVSSGTLEPGASTRHEFEAQFDETGEYTITIGDVTLPVTVLEPATASVTGFEADRTNASAGEEITLTVDVANEAPYPGELEIPLTRDGEEIDTDTVRLDAEGETTLTFSVTLTEPGTVTFGLGTASSETISLTATGPSSATQDDPAEAAPGLGAGLALAVLLLWAMILSRRR